MKINLVDTLRRELRFTSNRSTSPSSGFGQNISCSSAVADEGTGRSYTNLNRCEIIPESGSTLDALDFGLQPAELCASDDK